MELVSVYLISSCSYFRIVNKTAGTIYVRQKPMVVNNRTNDIVEYEEAQRNV
jgi:hypothetical protein